jgi:hypothetical protein
MKRWMLVGLSLLLPCVVLPEVRVLAAEPPGPQPNGPPVMRAPMARFPPRGVRLAVQVDEKAKVARLQVPLNLIPSRPAGSPPARPGIPPRRGTDAGRHGVPAVVAGIALVLAFALGGLGLVRRRARRSFANLLVFSLFAAGTAAVWADHQLRPSSLAPLPPQPPAPFLPTLNLPVGVELSEQLLLEVVPTGDRVTLIVPKAMILKRDRPEAAKAKIGK